MTREFILNTLLPYKEDPSTCGFNTERKECKYQTENGKKCAVGKHLVDGKHLEYSGNVMELFDMYNKEDILSQEAFDQNLSDYIWTSMQDYHDSIAMKRNKNSLNENVVKLEKLTKLEFPELYFD